ncbi:hypothetical protein PBAL39_20500 [Pedobacter sp. BAL39]|uniref:hypothetical protein n=1 Tax=Pedobacter sp. BAL39 TaxID=391596 RepID=UPI000155A18D|nr:hypothetical protein [Pedobacter sp. BAL39]EDM38491.1 hypothetical protein PBAL39_20500 [Pedobacter sp. BAL39]
MKKYAYLIILSLATIFTACKKDKIEHANDFEKSFKAWTTFKNTSGNTYSYIVVTSSWTGYSTETTLRVVNGQITGRSYIAKGIKGNPSSVYVVEEWSEDVNALNTHESGAALLTLDQVYDLAKNDLLLKRSNVETSFEAKNNGLISSAGYVENGCQDDCFRGISIKSISNL